MTFVPGELCEVCGAKTELSTCTLCGANVCSECYCTATGYCSVCMEAKCTVCDEYLSSRACNICGMLVCEDHGKKVNEVTICTRCQEKRG
jgi:hypothetical protein